MSETRAACSSESHRIRSPIQGGTNSSESSGASSSRARLTSMSNQKTSTQRAPRRVGRAGDRVNRVGHLVVGGDREDLAWLEVRAEADEQVGEALEVAGAILHRAADYRL